MSKLLIRYIRLAIQEATSARVPNQLIATDSEEHADDNEDDVNEFSGVGGIAGYTGPLGADPDSLGRKKNKRKR